MTRINFNFVNDVCYKGAFELTRSLKDGKPLGLEALGSGHKTIYEALSSLPEQVRKSWFAFDHFYSDIGFEEALPIIFAHEPKKIIDVGGNTAKWAIACCRYNPDVELLVLDLESQTLDAREEIERAGFSGRIKTRSVNILDDEAVIPPGADIIWMSPFLDCFSPEEISGIMAKVHSAAIHRGEVYILEPFWDKQRFEAASFSLQAASLYFACMANGNSRMYSFRELSGAVERAGFDLVSSHHKLGSNDYSLLHYRCRT
jgi:hypothetical protein